MSISNGVAPALISKVNDNGTVKVKFPWLPEEPETGWIRMTAPMAGKDRGMFFMPEVDDEVLVSYDQGSTNFPYVIGFLWNGKDKAPCSDKNIRKIKTKSGHIVEFDDKSDSASITIKTAGEQEIELNDKPKSITLKTGDNKIIMDKNGITIETNADVSIKGKNVNIEATSGITLKGPEVKIEATSQLTAKGNPIHLNP